LPASTTDRKIILKRKATTQIAHLPVPQAGLVFANAQRQTKNNIFQTELKTEFELN
jgi:hypothetical protein